MFIDSVFSQQILGRSPITKFYARTRKNSAKTSTKTAIDEAKLIQALHDEVLTPAVATGTDTDPLQKEDAI